jgi:hypothetical protein
MEEQPKRACTIDISPDVLSVVSGRSGNIHGQLQPIVCCRRTVCTSAYRKRLRSKVLGIHSKATSDNAHTGTAQRAVPSTTYIPRHIDNQCQLNTSLAVRIDVVRGALLFTRQSAGTVGGRGPW